MTDRRRGRPSRADGPAFDRDAVEQIIRHGELVPDGGGEGVRRWPGARELGRRYGVSATVISRFAASLGLPFRARFPGPQSQKPSARQGSNTETGADTNRSGRADPDWKLIDRILVEGEPVRLASGAVIDDYPSADEIASRFGVHASTVYRYMQRHRCLDRRAEHRRALLASAPVQLGAGQAEGLAHGEITVTGDPDDDYIIVRRLVAQQYRQAAEAGEIRARDPMIVRETDRLGREAHERKYGGTTVDTLQQLLEEARARAVAGRRRFEELPVEATGMVIETTGIELPRQGGGDSGAHEP